MMNDIAPELLEKLQDGFKEKFQKSKKIKKLNKLLETGEITHRESHDFALEVGDILAKVYQENITKDVLPEGRMWHNIAERVIQPTMGQNYDLISTYSAEVQTKINKKAGFNLKGIKPKINQNRINGIIDKISEAEDYDKAKWLLNEPVVNFSQSIVDDTVKDNADVHHKLGLRPKIIRKAQPGCCDWCNNIAGVYDYISIKNTGNNVFRRHRYCRCTVEYIPGTGKRQDVWSKKWSNSTDYYDEKTEKRKTYNLKNAELKTFNSGSEGDQYFTKSEGYDKWNKSITDGEKASVNYYTADGFKKINAYNRKTGDWAEDGQYGKYIKDAKEKLKNASPEPLRKPGENIIAFKKRQTADPYYHYRAALKEEERILNLNSDLDNVISRFELKDNIMLTRGVKKEALPQFNKIQDLIGMTYNDPSYMSSAPVVPDLFKREYTLNMKIPSGKGRGAYLEGLSSTKNENEFLIAKNSQFKITDVKIRGSETIIEMEWIE